MNLEEALDHVLAGGRATCDVLPTGTVLKTEMVGEWPAAQVRVVWEANGDGFTFTDRLKAECEGAEWRKVEGWASYG